jgi:hypothetical protein
MRRKNDILSVSYEWILIIHKSIFVKHDDTTMRLITPPEIVMAIQ